MFLIADAEAIQETVRGAREGLEQESGRAASSISYQQKNAQGDPGNVQSIARLMAGSDSNLFLVVGTSATIALAQVERSRPVITLGMADPVGAKVARTLARPGSNVTGSTDYLDPAVQLQEMLKVRPAPRRIGTVYQPSEPNAVKWVADFEAAAKSQGINFVTAAANTSTDIGIAARSLVGRVDAIIIGNDANTLAGVAAVAATARQAKIPLYLNGGEFHAPGVFAALGPDYFEVGRMAGVNAGRVCRGSKPGDLPFAQPTAVHWGINVTTLKEMHLTVPADILDKAAK